MDISGKISIIILIFKLTLVSLMVIDHIASRQKVYRIRKLAEICLEPQSH